MATVNGDTGYTQLDKLNVRDTLLVQGNPVTSPADMTVERLLDGDSVAVSQEPTGTGDAGKIQIEFGPAVNSGSDPVQLLSDGTLQFNEAGTYRLKITVKYGRLGGAGVSFISLRALVNGTQAGRTVQAEVDNANTLVPYSDEAWLTVPAGVAVTYEICRDAAGNDSGGVFAGTVTATGWNESPSASIRVERFV